MHDYDKRSGRGKYHRREIANRVEWKLREQARVDRERTGRTHEEGIAIGRRLGYEVCADVTTRTRPVIHDDLLAERFSKRERNDACDEVGRATGSQWNDKSDRLRRICASLVWLSRHRD